MRFVGEPVALVVADTRGAALVKPLRVWLSTLNEVVTDPIAAMHPGVRPRCGIMPDNISFL